MTTTSLPRYPGRQRVTQARVMRSEWIKLRTQPSALWSLASAVILIIAFGILYSLLREARPPQGVAAIRSFDPVSVSLSGVQLAQIATGVLGVLLITSEYATGLIRTTLAAVPRRLPVLWGKAAMVAAVTVAVTLPAALAVFLAGQEVLSRQHLAVSLGHPGVAQAVIGSSLYLAVCGLLGLALGATARSTAGGISALFGLFFALPIVAGFLPGSWSGDIGKYLPSTAGLAITTVHPDPATSLAPWAGLGVSCLYAAVLLGFAALRTRRGDAKLRRGLPRWPRLPELREPGPSRRLPPGEARPGLCVHGEVVGEGQDVVAAGGYLGVVRGQDDRAAGLAARGSRDGEHAGQDELAGDGPWFIAVAENTRLVYELRAVGGL
jgi:ABC-2 type transport system permease protein